MGNPFRVAEIFHSCLPWAKPSAPGLSAQVIEASCHLALNTSVRSKEQYEYVVYSDLDERVLPTRPNIRLSIIFVIHIMIHIFSLVELIKEVDDGGSSSFGILVTFYLSIWKVASSFCILFKGINFITSMIEKTRKYKFDEKPG